MALEELDGDDVDRVDSSQHKLVLGLFFFDPSNVTDAVHDVEEVAS